MKCPVCAEPMIVFEQNHVEVDHCASCGGVWLDESELELLLEDKDAKNNFLNSLETHPKTLEKARKCPICLKKMSKVSWGNGRKILMDRCPRTHGLWFDKGELKEVTERAVPETHGRVPMFFKGVFRQGR